MNITYDKSSDAMYIKLNESAVYRVSKKVTEDILVDYSEDGKIIGLEILTASKNAILPVSGKTIPLKFTA